MFSEVKNTSAYWNLLRRATNPKVRKNIGLLKREDDTLAFADAEKASLMNSYFAMIGPKLFNTLPPTDNGQGITSAGTDARDVPLLA